MKTEKMSLKGIKNVLSRDEMKKIMAGSHGGACFNMPGIWYGSCTLADIQRYCRYGGACF